jgi:hypothetical protein
MINDKDGHILLPLIWFTCTALGHTLLEWQKNKTVHLKADRHDPSNNFNDVNDGGKHTSCCDAMGRKLLTMPDLADKYTFLIITWNTLPESYQQRAYTNTLATVKHQIQQAENAMPAMVISVDTARVDTAIPLDYLTSEVALEEPKIGSTDRNIQIDNNCTDHELYFGMPGGSRNYQDECDESNERDAIPILRRQRQPATELERFDLGSSDVDLYEGEDGDDADSDADDEEEASQADD